jgi:hypothetical protein
LKDAELRQGLNLFVYVGDNPVNNSDALGLAKMGDATFGGGIGGGVSTITCCNAAGHKIKATFVKTCYGLYLGISATVGPVSGVDGPGCPMAYGGWFLEISGGAGIIAGGGAVSTGGDVGAPSLGIGIGGGVWMCKYALLSSEDLGCCK